MAKRISAAKSANAPKIMVFGKENYLLVAFGVVLIFVGFLLMYFENEIDGFISLFISPVLIVGGFAEIVYAIMKKSVDEYSEI